MRHAVIFLAPLLLLTVTACSDDGISATGEDGNNSNICDIECGDTQGSDAPDGQTIEGHKIYIKQLNTANGTKVSITMQDCRKPSRPSGPVTLTTNANEFTICAPAALNLSINGNNKSTGVEITSDSCFKYGTEQWCQGDAAVSIYLSNGSTETLNIQEFFDLSANVAEDVDASDTSDTEVVD